MDPLETPQEESQAGPARSGSAPRKTQRAPVSCSACARRKVKCEKVFPCSRCVQKGIADQCKREVVQVKGRVVGGAADDGVLRREFSIEDYAAENKALRRLLKKALGHMPTEAEIDSGSISPPAARKSSLGPAPAAPPTQPAPPTASGSHFADQARWDATEDVDGLIGADLTTVGMAADSEGYGKKPREVSPDVSYLIPFAPGVTRSTRLRYILSLVPIDQSRDLISLGLKLLGWIHGVLDHAVFLQEHDVFIGQLHRGEFDQIRLEWLSIYFAVLASSSYFLGESWDRQRVCTPAQRLEFPRLWFSASLETLFLSDFMTHHTMPACQTICILTLVAFNFGASSMLISLLHQGLRMAQTLGFHILVAEPENEIPAPGLRERELKRAIWGALSLGDALSPASHQPHALFIPEGISVPQGNLPFESIQDGQLFRPLPLSTWTRQSVHLFLNHVGRLFRRFNRQFWAAPDLDTQYRLVEEADSQLLAIVALFPQLHVSDVPYPTFIDLDSDNVPTDRWMQHHLAVNIPRLRMGLHRCFLRKSYQDPHFLKSRQICLDGARAILKERQRVVPALFDRAWHITSDTVAAGVILCAIYREERDLVEKRRLFADVQGCIAVLNKGGQDNTLVSVGINLLNSYLTSPPPSPPAAVPVGTPAAPFASLPPSPAPWQGVPLSQQHLSLRPPVDPTLPPPVPPFDASLAPPPSTADFSVLPQNSMSEAGEWSVPDLWSSLELAGAGGTYDPFGGWEAAASLDWSWAQPTMAGGLGGEYDPSRPAF